MTEHQRKREEIISRMYLAEEMTAKEIADKIGMKVGALRTYLNRHRIIRRRRK